MFKRQIRIDMVKAPRKDEQPVNEEEAVTFEERVLYLGALANNTIRQVTILAVGYVAVDTIRKIAVNRLSK
jgi:hypothetical protein